MKNKRVVIITGGCGQIGLGIAESCLKAGYSVGLWDMADPNPKVQELLKKFPSTAQFCRVDITRENEIVVAIQKVATVLGDPTDLVNNAAIDAPPGGSSIDNCAFHELHLEDWEKVIDVNLNGAFLCSKLLINCFRRQKIANSIVNVSSIYGEVSPDQTLYEYRRKRGEEFYKPAAYGASKAALVNLTRYLGAFYAKDNINVNAVAFAGLFNYQDPEFLDAYLARIPIGRMASLPDLVEPIMFLLGSGASYMVGSVLTVDGGWTAI